MSRYTGSVCKLCRREREKLFLKGERCVSKCTLERKRGKNLPGQHGAGKGKASDYARHLREKQKAKRVYGLTEQQFKHYFKRAEKVRKGLTGDTLLKLLELRLDNVVYRLGFFPSRKLARQMVNHGLISVNGRRINLPGYQVKAGDKINIKDKLKDNPIVKKCLEAGDKCPSWLSVEKEKLAGSIITMPGLGEFSHPINSQLIVELYSK